MNDELVVKVVRATSEDRARLSALLQLYVYDFSEILAIDVEEDGRFRAPSLDRYFAEPDSHPFLLRADDKLAGFALVQKGSRLSGDASVFDMAELGVLRKYRRQGVGERAAGWLFGHFGGPWEVRQRIANHTATLFWRRTIERYTAGKFTERLHDDESWRGPVQMFDSRL